MNGSLHGMMAMVLVLGLGLAGCASTGYHQEMAYRPVMPRAVRVPEPRDGAIYQAGHALSLFDDNRARRVGDVLTVVLQEKTQATKKATTSAKKSDSVALDNPTLLGSALRFDTPWLPHGHGRSNGLGAKLGSKHEFSGEGDSSQSNSLSGNITVTVARVLPNGNLVVRGEKWLTLNQGDEYIRVSGIVRPIDIRADNSILSSQIADAHIVYSGKGTVHDANVRGWLGRFFASALWPF